MSEENTRSRLYILPVVICILFTILNFRFKTGVAVELSLRIAGGLPFVILLLEIQDSKYFSYFGYFVLIAVTAAEAGIFLFM